MKYAVCLITMLLLLFGCKKDITNTHHVELLAAEKVEEVSEGVFLVGWIRVMMPENDSEVQIIPVEMDEPYIHWVQWGLQKQDINFDGYTDIGVTQHGGAKWSKLFWWLYDPDTRRYYRNSLCEEISKLTHAWFWTVPNERQIKITAFYGANLTEYTYQIAEGHLHLVEP
jgi:hypothetical protein